MDQNLQILGVYLREALPSAILKIKLDHEQLTLFSKPKEIYGLLSFLRDDSKCLFKVLIDICGVDYPEKNKRFEVVYHLLSLRLNQRIRVKVELTENGIIPSISEIFSAANWYERETWDLYGIMFSGHSDLRRLLTDYGFDGHPLRKDFPLTGYVEVRYDEEQKRVVYEPVKLTQAYRNFDFLSPWEGTEYTLPSDKNSENSSKSNK